MMKLYTGGQTSSKFPMAKLVNSFCLNLQDYIMPLLRALLWNPEGSHFSAHLVATEAFLQVKGQITQQLPIIN